ncbi:MAG: CvpA family protein [Clostridiales bacterium]|nr:CvpA family protein [Clostridiales bacterium]
MWLDVLIAIIFVFSTAQGYRKGFVRTFIHTAGWLVSIIVAFVFYPQVKDFLGKNTGLYNYVNLKVHERISTEGSAIVDPISDNLPVILKDFINTAEEAVSAVLADGLSGFLFHIISFLAVVIAIKIIFLILSSLFSKKNRRGIIGFIDGFFGLIAGAVKGIIIIFILLALMVPVISLSSGEFLVKALYDSNIAMTLYDNNLILLIIKNSLLN